MVPEDLTPRWRLWLERQGAYVIGDREASLLDAIERARSIKEAARLAGVSYRTAWAAIRAMERAFGAPVVRSRAGGPGGGNTTLTDDARELLRLYGELRRRLGERVEREFRVATS